MQEITDAVLSASREAVTLCMTMTGILAFWQGLMEVAKDAGLTKQLCRKIRPLIRFLFPKIPADHPAYESISMNFIANFLGLGMAATPAGLKAMKDLESLEEKRRSGRLPDSKPVPPGTASRENVYLPDHEYFLSSADPCHHDRLPQPVRKREPRRHHIPGHSGYGSEYRGGSDLLQGDGKMRKQENKVSPHLHQQLQHNLSGITTFRRETSMIDASTLYTSCISCFVNIWNVYYCHKRNRKTRSNLPIKRNVFSRV